MASIPGHGRTPLVFVTEWSLFRIDKEVEEDGDTAFVGDIGAELSKLDHPGMVNIVDPPCNQVVRGISLAEVTSWRLFLETGNSVDRLIGNRGVEDIPLAVFVWQENSNSTDEIEDEGLLLIVLPLLLLELF